MIAHGYGDCLSDLNARVRTLAGERAVIGVDLDPHRRLTVKRLDFDPSIDTRNRGFQMLQTV